MDVWTVRRRVILLRVEFVRRKTPVLILRCTDIDDEFKSHLQKLVPLLLAPENLVQKEIGGQKVKVKELVQYFKCYMNLFSGDDLPEPKSMLVVSEFLLWKEGEN